MREAILAEVARIKAALADWRDSQAAPRGDRHDPEEVMARIEVATAGLEEAVAP